MQLGRVLCGVVWFIFDDENGSKKIFHFLFDKFPNVV